MKLTEYFLNYFETWETHHIPGLETRNYKCFKNIVVDALKKMERELGGKFVDENQFGEMLYETKNYNAVITVVFYNGKTSVDIKIEGKYFIPLGRPVKDIKAIYAYIEKELKQYIGE